MSPHIRRAALNVAIMTSLAAAAITPCRADAGQNATQSAAPISTVLQVSGTASRFTITADHADVKAALNLLFSQAKRQFTLSGDAAGQITMRLMDQPFLVALRSICDESYLKYKLDPATEVYTIERDDEKIRADILRVRALTALEVQQLQRMGLQQNLSFNGYGRAAGASGQSGGGGFGGGGFGGGLGGGGGGLGGGATGLGSYVGGRPGDNAAIPPLLNPAGSGGVASDQNPAQWNLSQQSSSQKSAAQAGPSAARKSGIPAGVSAPIGILGVAADGASGPVNLLVPPQYRQVELRIPTGEPIPVTAVLESLSKQADVAIRVDPAVPAGPVFRMSANIPKRSLTEMLNLITPPARLEWYWSGDSIFVSTAPTFQIFFGDSTVPKVSVGAAAKRKPQP